LAKSDHFIHTIALNLESCSRPRTSDIEFVAHFRDKFQRAR